MTEEQKTQKIMKLLKSNLSSQQVKNQKESDKLAFYVTMGETETTVIFPLELINNLELKSIDDYFKNELNLYNEIKSSKSISALQDGIVILPNK